MDRAAKTYAFMAILGLGIGFAAWSIFFEIRYNGSGEPRYLLLIPAAVAILIFAGGFTIVPSTKEIDERELKIASREAKLKDERKSLDEIADRQKAEDRKLRNEERRISDEIRHLESVKTDVSDSMRANDEYMQKLKNEKRRLLKEQEAIDSQRSQINEKEEGINCERERITLRERALLDRESRLHDAERRLEQLQLDHQQRHHSLSIKVDSLTREIAELETQKSRLESDIANMSITLQELDDRDSELRKQQAMLRDNHDQLEASKQVFETEKRDFEIARHSLDADIAMLERNKNQVTHDHAKLIQDRLQHQAEVNDLASSIAAHKVEESSLCERLKSLEAERVKLATEQEQAKQDLASATSLKEQAAQYAAQAAEDLRTVEAKQAEIKHFFEQTWHSAFGGNPIEPTIDSIQSDAISNSNAAMVLANVQILGAANRSEETRADFNQLIGPLRGIGRFLAAYLRDCGKQPAEVIKTLTCWANTLNAASDGRYDIMVPSQNETFRGSSMESQEDGIDQVSEVLNWAISNDRSIIAHRAEVL